MSENIEQRPQPVTVETKVPPERAAYTEKVKAFLGTAEIGSPRLLVVNDLAEDLRVDVQPKPGKETEQHILQAISAKNIKEHTIMIPGYIAASEEFYNLDGEGRFNEKALEAESKIAHSDPNRTYSDEQGGSLEEVADMASLAAADEFQKLVDQRVEEITQAEKSTQI